MTDVPCTLHSQKTVAPQITYEDQAIKILYPLLYLHTLHPPLPPPPTPYFEERLVQLMQLRGWRVTVMAVGGN